MFDLAQRGAHRARQQCSDVKSLTLRAALPDTERVPDKEGNGFDSLIAKERMNGAMPFFYVCMSSRVLNERRWRGSLRAYWFSFLHQSINPVICRSPRLIAGSGSTAKRNTIMPSPSTSTQSRTDIDNRAKNQAKNLVGGAA